MRSRARFSTLAVIGALFALAMAVPTAQAQFGIESFTAEVLDAEGNFYEQAGGHPYVGITDFTVNTDETGAPEGGTRNIHLDVPAGLMSNPEALPRCTDAQLETFTCPPETQLGTEELTVRLGPTTIQLKVPLYNMTTADMPDPQVARFAFNPAQAATIPGLAQISPTLAGGLQTLHSVEIVGSVRWQSDYGTSFDIVDLPATAPLIRTRLTFWGTPADPSHNPERGQSCVGSPLPFPPPGFCSAGGQVSTATPVPFLTNPTLCAGTKLETRLTLTSQTGEVATASSFTPTTSNGGEGPQNCAAVPFAGGFELTPDTTALDAPTGPLVNLTVPQEGLLDPNGIATSHVRDITVVLPPGLTLNPSVANGLEACSDAQFGKGTSNPIACPEASAIGTVTIRTPLLADPLRGTAYVGQPLEGDQYRLFLAAAGNGVSARFIGSVRPDPSTGQLTAVFPDNPQTPFASFSVDFRDGPLAPLATPWDCGPKTSTARLTAYSGAPDATPSSTFESGGSGCQPLGFQPGFAASPERAIAGAFSPFHALIVRDDRHQFLDSVRVKLPPGLLGMVSRVDQCADAQAAAGTCGAGSRIGTASVLAGAGPRPYGLAGPVYLTGPYQGGAFGIAVVIRAIAGPYDLGTVIVRQPIHVDPEDARLTVTRAPLPRILEGVPVRLRQIKVDVDRPGFMRNPTSCKPMEVRATLHSTEGAAIDRPVPFRVGNCDALAFRPRISMRMTGKRMTVRGRHPGLRTRVVQGRNQASIGRARLALPLSLALDPDNAKSICGFEAGQRARCPGRARIGRVTAVSPALDDRLKGVVYLVQGVRIDPDTGNRIRTLPTLLFKLRGQVRINVRARTDVNRGRLVTRFQSLPDVPVSRFYVRLKGGKGGILAATRNDICDRRQFARVRFRGHNGKPARARVKVARPCPRPKSQARRGA
jgi:hypothetical protein